MKSSIKPVAIVKVGHLDVKVFISPEPLSEMCEMRGMFDPRRNEIWVGEGYEGYVFQEVFWHELIHAFYRAYGWSHRMTEEELVKHFAPALVTFINQNPKFVSEYLT